jgi:predicted metal-dependent phosphoesterase TrpH
MVKGKIRKKGKTKNKGEKKMNKGEKKLGSPLLCDFHIHTTFSDGEMKLKEVIDLYGVNGFDVIAITDHVFDTQCPHSLDMIKKGASISNFDKYFEAVKEVSSYAREKYDLLILPGIEVTNNKKGFHILGLDIKKTINANLSAREVIEEIHRQEGLAIACHPYYKISELQDRQKIEKTTLYLWENRERYLDLIDAWEIANQDDLFSVVGLSKLPFLANSDLHEKKHIYSWKTQVFASKKNPSSIKKAIKEQRVSLTLFRDETEALSSPHLANKDYFSLAFPQLAAT